MTFGQLLDRARAGSMRKIVALRDSKQALGRRVVMEPAPRGSDDQIVCASDGLRLPLRFDIASRDENSGFKTDYADSVCVTWGSPVIFQWSDRLRIEARALRWDYMDVRATVSGDSVDEELFRSWFLRWFDSEDGNCRDSEGFAGVLHFLSDLTLDGTALCFTADFGSAPVRALEELFDVLDRIGATDCILGSKDSA